MRLINTNLLNYFYKNAITPLKNAVAKKLDSAKLSNNLLTTEAGFGLDARQGPVIDARLNQINSNLSDLFIVVKCTEVSVLNIPGNAAASNGYSTTGILAVPYTLPTGYTPILAIPYSPMWYAQVSLQEITNALIKLTVFNGYGTAQSITIGAFVLAKKDT